MKKILLLTIISVFLLSCGAYNHASYVSKKCDIGMSMDEFKKIAGRRAKVESVKSNGQTIFRSNDYDAFGGQITETKFFYFLDGKLVQIDNGN